MVIRKCHVLGLAKKELKSIIKKSQHYGIQGIIYKTSKGISLLESGENLLLPQHQAGDANTASSSTQSHCSGSLSSKVVRAGKGSHAITTIKALLQDEENWQIVTSKHDYQFPGVFSCTRMQSAFYVEDCMQLPQATPNPHYMWEDIQISKSGWNMDREVTVEISGTQQKLMYRVCSCNGVKSCPIDSCSYTAPLTAQRACREHPTHKLVKSNSTNPCPVQIAYIYPKVLSDDHRWWLFAFIRHQKFPTDTLHNHPISNSSKICSKVKEMIAKATEINPTLKPNEIAKGKGLSAIPGVIDKASNHLGKLSREVKKAKLQTIAGSKWSISDFEKIATEIDSADEALTGNSSEAQQLMKLTRPYLVSAGIEDGTNYVLCMNPFMCSLLSTAEFIEADITYGETKEYRYLFNMVAFDYTTMDWQVVSRVRLDKQDANAYALAYSKTFAKCKSQFENFVVGESLLGIVIDWSDAEIKGLEHAVGKDLASKLLRGCNVHWARSWQRVRDRVAFSEDKVREKALFAKIASAIPKLPGNALKHAFGVLSKTASATTLVSVVEGFTQQDAAFIDKHTNWASAVKWAEWWLNPRHLHMLHKNHSDMADDVWDRCPSNTNAVERKNLDSKELLPQQLQTAMVNLYKYDKAACAKHIAAEHNASVCYRDKSEQARRNAAAKRNACRRKSSVNDELSEFGPPDRQCNYGASSSKRKRGEACASSPAKRSRIATPDDDMDDFIPTKGRLHQCKTNYLGKKLKMRFRIEETNKFEWFNGQILNFDPMTGKYGAFFPCDGQTVYINPAEEDEDIIYL